MTEIFDNITKNMTKIESWLLLLFLGSYIALQFTPILPTLEVVLFTILFGYIIYIVVVVVREIHLEKTAFTEEKKMFLRFLIIVLTVSIGYQFFFTDILGIFKR